MEMLKQWQKDYEQATGKQGTVTSVEGILGRYGGLAIWVEVEEDGETVFYSPHLNPSPFDDCPEESGESCLGGDYDHTCTGHDFELDEHEWIDSMTGATNWGEWNWGDPEISVLSH